MRLEGCRPVSLPRGSALASPFETHRFAMLLRVRVGFCVCAARALRALVFHLRYSHCFTAANFIFDFIPSRNILSLSRSVKGRAASVFVAWQRDAVVRHDAGLRTPRGLRFLKADGAHTPATRADGPSACPGDSSHERGASAVSDKPWGMQQAAKSIRVRNAGESASVAAGLELAGPGPHAACEAACGSPCADAKRHTGARMQHAGAAGAAFRPVVPHAPRGQRKAKRRPASPVAEMNTGR